jgi:hypothetical protein
VILPDALLRTLDQQQQNLGEAMMPTFKNKCAAPYDSPVHANGIAGSR